MQNRHDDVPGDPWRLTIDREVKDLSNEMSGMKAGMDAMNKTMLNLVDAFDGAQSKQQENQKTPWANYLSAFALILVMVGMVGSGYVRDLNRLENTLEKLQTTLSDKIFELYVEVGKQDTKLAYLRAKEDNKVE